MLTRRALLAATMLVAVIVAVIAWVAWNAGQCGWAHIIGSGASVLLLVLIWIWPGNWQPGDNRVAKEVSRLRLELHPSLWAELLGRMTSTRLTSRHRRTGHQGWRSQRGTGADDGGRHYPPHRCAVEEPGTASKADMPRRYLDVRIGHGA